MRKKLLIPATLAASALGVAAVLPTAYAEATTAQKIEARSEASQSAVRDAWLHGKLETALLFNEHLNSFAINSEVNNGNAHLFGVVESDIDRDLAEEIAKSIEGIHSVENELEIDKVKAKAASSADTNSERQGFKRSVLNATLTARVKSRLLLNDNTGGLSIDVDSRDGVVTLSGNVDSDQEKELAAQIAENTTGTISVNDKLNVERVEEAE